MKHKHTHCASWNSIKSFRFNSFFFYFFLHLLLCSVSFFSHFFSCILLSLCYDNIDDREKEWFGIHVDGNDDEKTNKWTIKNHNKNLNVPPQKNKQNKCETEKWKQKRAVAWLYDLKHETMCMCNIFIRLMQNDLTTFCPQ